jgi:hypothetical protein
VSKRRMFIDEHQGQWYVVDGPRGDWMEFKERGGEVPDYARPIYRNKPRAVTFIGEGWEEWT